MTDAAPSHGSFEKAIHLRKADSDLPVCWGDITALTAPGVLHTADPARVTCEACLKIFEEISENLERLPLPRQGDYPGGGMGGDICQRSTCGHIRGTHAPPTWAAPPGTQRCFCGCEGFVEKVPELKRGDAVAHCAHVSIGGDSPLMIKVFPELVDFTFPDGTEIPLKGVVLCQNCHGRHKVGLLKLSESLVGCFAWNSDKKHGDPIVDA